MGAVVAEKPPEHAERAEATRAVSDERLAMRVRAGDESAFAALYVRYRLPLGRYCRSIVGEAEDAGDALQNTMIAALRALRARPLEGDVKPWLYRIAHNESVSVLRRRRGHEPLQEDTAQSQPVADGLAEWEALIADLRCLPERQRASLLLRELAGLSYDEIGVTFAITPTAARKAVFEARSSLATIAIGRETACATIRERISAGDRRALRARGVRAHLAGCPACSSFVQDLDRRRAVLATVPAVPATAALAGLGLSSAGAGAGATAGAGGAGLISGIGAALAGGSGSSVVLKGLAACAVCAIAGGGVVSALPHSRAVTPLTTHHVAKPRAKAARAHHRGAMTHSRHALATSHRVRSTTRQVSTPAARMPARTHRAPHATLHPAVATPHRPAAPPTSSQTPATGGNGTGNQNTSTTPAPGQGTSTTTATSTTTTTTGTSTPSSHSTYDPLAFVPAPVRRLVNTVLQSDASASSAAVSSAAQQLQALISGGTLSSAAQGEITTVLGSLLPSAAAPTTTPAASSTNPIAALLEKLFK